MYKKFKRWLSVLLVVLLIIPWSVLAGGSGTNGYWIVKVSHNLNGGQWQSGRNIEPHTMAAEIGKSMGSGELHQERSNPPVKVGADFLGWSVLFTSALDGTVIYDSGEEVWDLNHPFDYYPSNPFIMNCKMTARWKTQGNPESGVWQVNISHDLGGGSWPEGWTVKPYAMTAKIGQSMAADSLYIENYVMPHRAGSVFLGWSVLFTDYWNGTVIYDSGEQVWDLNHPFDYYPNNPLIMNCKMTARWKTSQLGGDSSLPKEILPDGRELTRSFAIGTEPLPEIPPPSNLIIAGTTWLTNALICGIDEGTKVPVYSFPVYNGPVIDWVGLDDSMDYGLYLGDGWVMLYHPKWVEAAGIGFIAADVIAFPGSEE